RSPRAASIACQNWISVAAWAAWLMPIPSSAATDSERNSGLQFIDCLLSIGVSALALTLVPCNAVDRSQPFSAHPNANRYQSGANANRRFYLCSMTIRRHARIGVGRVRRAQEAAI